MTPEEKSATWNRLNKDGWWEAQIIQTRIEMCHYRNAQWQALLQFIDGQSHMNTLLADPDYAEWVHRFFDVSHQVWHKIQEMARGYHEKN